MSGIKRLDEMRDYIKRGGNRLDTSLSYLDAIEAEIAERYMKLPVDADGVPIHCGDYMKLDNGHKGNVWLIGAQDIMMSDHMCFDWAKSRHVKPRTLEDVLYECFHDCMYKYPFGIESIISKYADELRSMEVDE